MAAYAAAMRRRSLRRRHTAMTETAQQPPLGGCPPTVAVDDCIDSLDFRPRIFRQEQTIGLAPSQITSSVPRLSNVLLTHGLCAQGKVTTWRLRYLMLCSGGCMRRHMPPDSQQDPQPSAVAVVLALLNACRCCSHMHIQGSWPPSAMFEVIRPRCRLQNSNCV